MRNTFRSIGIIGFIVFFMFMAVFLISCTRSQAQQYCPEDHFRIYAIGGIASIVNYVGNRQSVRIPPNIHGMPVRLILFETVTDIWGGIRQVGAFEDRDLVSVTIPNTVIAIEFSAFAGNQLNSITIPNSVRTIGRLAFRNNRLTSITIGANVDLVTRAPGDISDWPPFDNNFHVFYNNNGRRAGTYTWNGTTWSFSAR